MNLGGDPFACLPLDFESEVDHFVGHHFSYINTGFYTIEVFAEGVTLCVSLWEKLFP